MTEDEAKTKWCPMARAASNVGAFNRNSDGDAIYNSRPYAPCIASACMMWQTTELPIKYDSTNKAIYGGYCGLATTQRG